MSRSEMHRPEMHHGCSSGLPPKFQDDEKKRIHFFRIIHNFIIQNKQLELPEKIIKNFGRELSEVAVIMVPTGKMWRIELRKAEGRIAFQNGWQEFMDYYSIRVGHFLVFRYDGNSCFHVLIFDMSASEILYESPCHTKDFEEHNHEKVLYEDKNQSSARSENPSSYSKDVPETVINSSDSRSEDEPTMFTQLKSASSRGRVVRCCSTQKIHNAPESRKMGFSAPLVNRRNEREATAKALRAAREFKSKNPFCTITMCPSYVSEKFILNVPVDFAKYLIQETRTITLWVSDERTWQIQCICSGYGTKLIKGWKEFAVDNQLEKGDVCVFELVDKNIKVYIFRSS